MKISQDALEEFRQLHRDRFGGDISLADAELAARQLIRLVAITQPHVPLNVLQELQK